MTNSHEKAFKRADEIFNLLLNQEDLNEQEKFILMMRMGKICLTTGFAHTAYSCRKNPHQPSVMEKMKDQLMEWIEEAIQEGNNRYEQELN